MSYIFHIISHDVWETARSSAEMRVPSLDSEGFIHFSTVNQVVKVANKHYHGVAGLGVLVVETEKLAAPLRYEPPYMPGEIAPPTDELFPHLYGPLNTSAVKEIVDFPVGADGTFTLSPQLEAFREA